MRKEDVLARCVDEIMAGHATVEQCVSRHPELGGQLRQLLEIAMSIPVAQGLPSDQFRWRTRNRLLAIMDLPEERGFRWDLKSPARAVGLSLLIVLLTVVAAGGGTVYAAQSSLPDDTLYPVKTGMEHLQLALTFNNEARATFRLNLAQRRIDEVLAESALNRTPSVQTLNAVAAQIDAALAEMQSAVPADAKTFMAQLLEATLRQQVALNQVAPAASPASQPALAETLDVARRANVIAQVGYGNPAFLVSSPSVRDQQLETEQFTLEGTVESIAGNTWNIGGVTLDNVNSVQTPAVGSRVKLSGLTGGKNVYISDIQQTSDTSGEVKMEGQFGGASPTGSVWYVGGIPVDVSENSTPPSQRATLHLQGTGKDGKVAVTQTQDEHKDDVKLAGVLTQVSDQGTIALQVAGAQVSINLDKAQIKTDDGQQLSMSDLKSRVGEDIKVNGIEKSDKGKQYTAKEARVERDTKSSKDARSRTSDSSHDSTQKSDSHD